MSWPSIFFFGLQCHTLPKSFFEGMSGHTKSFFQGRVRYTKLFFWMGCLNNPFTFFRSNVWLPKVGETLEDRPGQTFFPGKNNSLTTWSLQNKYLERRGFRATFFVGGQEWKMLLGWLWRVWARKPCSHDESWCFPPKKTFFHEIRKINFFRRVRHTKLSLVQEGSDIPNCFFWRNGQTHQIVFFEVGSDILKFVFQEGSTLPRKKKECLDLLFFFSRGGLDLLFYFFRAEGQTFLFFFLEGSDLHFCFFCWYAPLQLSLVGE